MSSDEAAQGHVQRRRWAIQLQQPIPPARLFDQIAFVIGTAAAVWMAIITAIGGFRGAGAVVWVIPVWAITAYVVLPRLHRILSDLYVPGYFFGRTRTADGLLGDPVNLCVDGSAAQLDHAMMQAGWHRADEITVASAWGIIVSTLTRRSYSSAPVSALMLFRRRHDVAYEQEVAGNPKQRHHVRFWHCPPKWLLPGGAATDWLGAGTYDTDIRLSFFTLQVTHRIDENTDVERDHVVSSMREANLAVTVRLLRNFTTGYHARNGGGDRFITDGDLPIVDVSAVEVPDPHTAPDGSGEPSAAEVIQRAPLTTTVAAFLVLLVSVIQLIDFLCSATGMRDLLAQGVQVGRGTVMVILVLFCAFKVLQLLMSWLVLRGWRRPRTMLIILLALEILAVAIDYHDGGIALGLNWTLFTASVQCLALLALSSESSGAWARQSPWQ